MKSPRTSVPRNSAQLCRLAGCLTALAFALPAALHAQDAAAPAPASTPTPAAAPAVSSGKGSLVGRVLNSGNGMYLSKAIVKVVGTDIETLTGEYGDFSLDDLPAGDVTLEISFTGLVAQKTTVSIEADKSVSKEFKLGRSRLTSDKLDKETVALDEFVVASERYKNAAEIAINEERYSPTIKNVIAADAFGDIPDGNIGEFVKYIPGVQVATGYDGAGSMAALDQNISQVSVRGFSSDMTAITIDGVPVTNASPATLSRSVGLDMMSVNNASRVEVIKVPTPDMPSNSPGGSINLITRSAFEFAKPSLNVKLMVNMNTDDYRDAFSKTPGPANKPTYKNLPGAEFSYTLPINSKLGVTVSGGASQTFYENRQLKSDYLYTASEIATSDVLYDMTKAGGSTVGRRKNADGSYSYTSLTNKAGEAHMPWNPLLYRIQAIDTPNTATRMTTSLKFDWKPTSSQKISVGYTFGDFATVDGQRRLQFYNGNKYGYLNWGDGYVIGVPYTVNGLVTTTNPGTSSAKTTTGNLDGKGTVNMTVTNRDRNATTQTGFIDYSFAKGPWVIDANINGSLSEGSYVDTENGHFSESETSITASQLMFLDIKDSVPGQVKLFKTDGSMVDWTRLTNWNALAVNGFKAKSGDTHASDTSMNAKINIRRDLDFIPISWMTISAKTGFYHQEQTAKKWGLGTGYYMTYDAVAAGQNLTISDYIDDGYSRSPGFGLPAQQWLDNYKLYKLWQEKPNSFSVSTEQNKSDNYKSWATQQKRLKETSDQYYFQLDGRAFKNRLNWVTGVRQEMAARKGYNTRNVGSWNFLHDAEGKIWRDTAVSAYATGIKLDSASSLLFKGLTFDSAGNSTGSLTADALALRSRLDAEKIWYPTAPIANNTLAAAKLQRIPFEKVDNKVTNKPNFMSSVAYDFTKNLTGRLSYSASSGRPDWENGILSVNGGSNNIEENTDPNAAVKGTITKANPALKPSENDSYDAQLAYYTNSGGKLAISGFYKETKNPQETVTVYDGDPMFDSLVEAEGLNPDDFRGWAWKTTINTAGTGKTIGYEVEASQDLSPLGGWLKGFNIFASYSHHYKKQQNTTYLTLKPTAGSHAAGGINFARGRFAALVRTIWLEEKYINGITWTINGQEFATGKYNPASLNMDVNLKYQLTRKVGLFFNARNVLNDGINEIRKDKDGVMPNWAQRITTKQYGVTMVAGVSASF